MTCPEHCPACAFGTASGDLSRPAKCTQVHTMRCVQCAEIHSLQPDFDVLLKSAERVLRCAEEAAESAASGCTECAAGGAVGGAAESGASNPRRLLVAPSSSLTTTRPLPRSLPRRNVLVGWVCWRMITPTLTIILTLTLTLTTDPDH